MYFDVLVRNSLQPHYILRAAVEAGAASEAGEIKKMNKKSLRQGAFFFPLVVETLGLWLPNSLKVLTSITSKASSLSGVPRSQVISNLLQHLSVHLWTFNARMVHARIEMEGGMLGTGTCQLLLLNNCLIFACLSHSVFVLCCFF